MKPLRFAMSRKLRQALQPNSSPMNPTLPAPAAETVTVNITNCTPADAKFIRNVVAVFTDPKHRASLDKIRSGHSSIRYERRGSLAVYPTQPLQK